MKVNAAQYSKALDRKPHSNLTINRARYRIN